MRKLFVLAAAVATGLVPGIFLSQAHAAGAYTVTAKVNTTSVSVGQDVTMTGTVSPKAAGQKIRLQQWHSDQDFVGWETLHTATIQSNGTFSKTFAPNIGTQKWRAYKMYGAGRTGGVSKVITIKGYRWYQLVNGSFLEFMSDTTGGPGRNGPITVAGTQFKSYWESAPDATGSTRWDLNRGCRRFTGTVGLDDDPTRTASGAFGRVMVTGTPEVLVNKSMNGSTKLAVDVSFQPTDHSWITISASRLYPERATSVVVANAKVQCSFPPRDENEDD